MYSTQEVLEIAQQAEVETVRSKRRNRRREPSSCLNIQHLVEGDVESDHSEAESDCIVVAQR